MSGQYSNLKLDGACSLLKKWREDSARCSEDIIEIWEKILFRNINKLGNEKWNILEQVCLAAIDTSQLELVDYCIKELHNQFQNSLRVRRLKAMKLEAMERYLEAFEIYELILKRDPTNAVARKRKIAIFRAQNRIPEAIKELIDYLRKLQGDQEAWLELCDLYIGEQEYSKAAFCLEELMMAAPHNHLFHQRYAEIKYTQGGQENLELAKSYFALAVKLNPRNMRALYGLYLASANLNTSSKTASQRKKENLKMSTWAEKQIVDRYATVNGDTNAIQLLEQSFSALALSGPN